MDGLLGTLQAGRFGPAPPGRATPRPAAKRPGAALPLLLLGMLFGASVAHAQTTPGTIIRNTADVSYQISPAPPARVVSNTDTFVVEAPPGAEAETSSLEILRWDPAGEAAPTLIAQTYFRTPGGDFAPVAPPALPSGAAPVAASAPGAGPAAGDRSVSLRPAQAFRSDEEVFFRLRSTAANRQPFAVEFVEISLVLEGTGTVEVLRLGETGPNTSLFTGHIRVVSGPPAPFRGVLSLPPNAQMRVATDAVAGPTPPQAFLVDPFGTVFDSRTGEPLDGVTVTLVDDATGAPAAVFGNDGTSAYPSTIVTGAAVRDASGATYTPKPGQFWFPLTAPGSYRIRVGLPPGSGYAFPAAEPDTALQALPGGPRMLGPGSRGRAFAVGLEPVQVDVPLDPSPASLALAKTATRDSAAAGDVVGYRLDLANNRALGPMRAVVIEDRLPPGFRFERGSARLGGRPAPDPATAADGRTLTFALGDLEPGATAALTYAARVGAARPGPAENVAIARSGPLQGDPARATVLVRDELMRSRAIILGRVTLAPAAAPESGPIGLPHVRVYLDDGTFVVTDAQGRYRFEDVRPGTRVVQVDLDSVPAGTRAVAGDLRHLGRPWSRMLDLQAGTAWTADFAFEQTAPPAGLAGDAPIPMVRFNPEGAPPAPAPGAVNPADPAPASFDQDWIDAQPAGYAWLLPEEGELPPLPFTRIVVRHRRGESIEAFLNGKPVDPVKFDGVLSAKGRAVSASLWSGINLPEGPSAVEIVRRDRHGAEIAREKRAIHYSAPPVFAVLVPEQSVLVADGVTTPLLAVRLLDRDRKPARQGVRGRYEVEAPHQPPRLSPFQLALHPGMPAPEAVYEVGRDGIARIPLEPTTVTGMARIRLPLRAGAVELEAPLRDARTNWIIVGVAEGTAAHRTISGNLETARDDGLHADGLVGEGRASLFAKGRIRGGWLLTLGLDTDREERDQGRPLGLEGVVDPDAYYSVYGDESQRRHGAPASGKLYVKLERERVEATFGQFNINWSDALLTAYERDLEGVKVETATGAVRFSGFASDSERGFRREEFPGGGLSGPFTLAVHPVAGTERVLVETRDRRRPEIVLATRALARNRDFTIDFGTRLLRLAEPLASTDRDLNPQVLVVTYESTDRGARHTYGGRVEWTPSPDVRVGATRLAEEDAAQRTVTGVDARVRITANLELSAEAARSRNTALEDRAAGADRVELRHSAGTSEAAVYYRSIDENFGLGHLGVSQVGLRATGAEMRGTVARGITIEGRAYQEESLASGAVREAAEAVLTREEGPWRLRTGVIAARDERAPGEATEESLLLLGGARRQLGEKVAVELEREQALGGRDESIDFPSRTRLGAEWALSERATVFTVQEWTEGAERSTSQTRAGVRTNPWEGANIDAAAGHQAGAAGGLFGATALRQRIALNEALSVEGGFEHARAVEDSSRVSPFRPQGAFAVAPAADLTSAHAGVTWNRRPWLASGRAEFARTSGSDLWNLLASAQLAPGGSFGYLSSLRVQGMKSLAEDRRQADLRLGAAWRPDDRPWTALSRFDLVYEDGKGGLVDLRAWRAVQNLHLNYRAGRLGQASVHLGAKYASDDLDGRAYAGWTTMTAAEVRMNITRRWDVGVHGSLLDAWAVRQRRFGRGLSLGFSPTEDCWMSIGYTWDGFDDRDFGDAGYTRQGLFVRFRLKFDQQSLGGLLRHLSEL